VRTELVSESQGKHVIQISVRDTGIGIPESAQSKLFNRFSQAKGLLRTSTRQTLHLLMHLSAPVSAFTLKVKSALIGRLRVLNDPPDRWTAALLGTTAGQVSGWPTASNSWSSCAVGPGIRCSPRHVILFHSPRNEGLEHR